MRAGAITARRTHTILPLKAQSPEGHRLVRAIDTVTIQGNKHSDEILRYYGGTWKGDLTKPGV